MLLEFLGADGPAGSGEVGGDGLLDVEATADGPSGIRVPADGLSCGNEPPELATVGPADAGLIAGCVSAEPTAAHAELSSATAANTSTRPVTALRRRSGRKGCKYFPTNAFVRKGRRLIAVGQPRPARPVGRRPRYGWARTGRVPLRDDSPSEMGFGACIGSGHVAPRHRPVDDERMIRGDGHLARSQRRARARVIQDELRLLLTRWDPIGVADDTEAADEYDCMIGPLYRLLQSGATTVEITGWLAAELDEHFGLADVPTDQDFAVDLQRWWAANGEAHET
jgi:hypothetical protein